MMKNGDIFGSAAQGGDGRPVDQQAGLFNPFDSEGEAGCGEPVEEI